MTIRPECIAAAAKALGREPTKKEQDSMEASLREGTSTLLGEDRAKVLAMTPAERMAFAADKAAEHLVAEAMKERQRTRLSVEAMAKLTKFVDQHPDQLAMIDELLAFKPTRISSVDSLDYRGRTISINAERKLLDLWQAVGPKWLGLFTDKAQMRDLVRALHGEKVDNPIAMEAAKAWHATTEEMRLMYNGLGGKIGRLADWGFPHHHSAEKVGKAGQDAWVSYTKDLLDRQRYFNEDGTVMDDEQIDKFLQSAFLSIALRGELKNKPGVKGGKGMAANRHAEDRTIHFKNADAFLEYQDKFGEKAFYEVLNGHIHAMSRDIATLEMFGPNPDHAYAVLRDRALRKQMLDNPAMADDLRERANKLDGLFGDVTGRTNPIASKRWYDAGNTTSALLIAARLGSSVVTALGDMGTVLMTAAKNNVSPYSVLRNLGTALNPLNRTEVRMLNREGLGLQTMVGSLVRLGDDSVRGMPQKIASAVMKASLLNAWTESMRRASGVMMMDAIGALTREHTLDTLDKADHSVLLSKGITNEDWSIWREAKLNDFGSNHNVLTGDAISNVDDSKVAQIIAPALQKIRDRADSEIGRLYSRDQRDMERLQKKMFKLEEAHVRAKDLLDTYTTRTKGKAEKVSGELRARGELLQARMERSAVEADINAYLLAQTHQEEIRGFLYAVEEGASADGTMPRVERKVQYASRVRGSIGEQLGQRVAKAEARIKEVEARIKETGQTAAAKISDRDAALTERLTGMADELKTMTARAEERFAQRRRQVDRINNEADILQQEAIPKAKQQAMLRFMSAIAQEVDMAVIEPGVRDRRAMFGGVQRGTPQGELVHALMLFKSFPQAIWARHVVGGRTVMGSKAMYVASLVAACTVLGGISTQVNEVISGRDPLKMGNGAFLLKSFLKGGALGIYGDFIAKDYSKYGNGFVESLGGPIPGLVDDVFNLTVGNIHAAAMGQDTHWEAELLRVIKGITPGSSLWYAKAALDHLIFQQIQEQISPGYLAKMNARDSEYGQQTFWDRGQLYPDRMPDLKRAFQ